MDEAKRVCTELGLRVIELRQEQRLTQEQLAERAHLDARDVRRIESGDNTTVHTLVRLASGLKVPITTLFEAPRSRVQRKPGRPATRQAAEPAVVEVGHRRVRGRHS